MFSAKGRYIFMGLFVLAIVVCLYYRQYQLASIGVLFLGFIVWAHYKHSSVLLASKYFKNQEYEYTAYYLNEVPNPNLLAASRRGYYEFMLANIALKEEDFNKAEYHFQIASRFPLGGKNDKAFVLIHLANIALRNKDAERARAYIEKAKELAVSNRAQDIIKIIEKEVNQLT
ncbi:MAG: hypothetical protein EOO99_07270 [Pedobacter sp.]|nr:MAG: hypothetical protein EOO99_07270 [Pedobacter sp.]